MKIAASILALIAFVAIFMTVLTEARLGRYDVQYDESVGRPSYTQGNGRTYRSNGYTMNSRGYLANPTRSAQINARNAGALTNSEARSMGLRNYRDEMDSHMGDEIFDEADESVGWVSNGYAVGSRGWKREQREREIKKKSGKRITLTPIGPGVFRCTNCEYSGLGSGIGTSIN